MTISIIGLGWLGMPLAKAFQQTGAVVKGSTTNAEKQRMLKNNGLICEQLVLDPEMTGPVPANLFDTELLFINIPPSSRSKPSGYHPKQIEVIKAIAMEYGIKKIIYTSSTSIYPSKNQLAKESDFLDTNNTGHSALFQAERILWKDKNYDLSVIRFGGLLGDNRIPGKYFSGKKLVPGHPPVNYIHRKDAVRAVLWLYENNLWNETFNIVSPKHPKKREVFEKNATEMGFPPPVSYENPESKAWKEISVEKWLGTGFQFLYDDPLDFTYAR
jgi:nucleoside-diphosphate-sugar epimerase